MTDNVLPDSRAKRATGLVFVNGAYHVPLYCAMCGKKGGFVPEENTTFAFWLCNECFATCGELTNMYVMPDEVFWEEVKNEQLESHGRFLTEAEFAKVLEDDASPLAKLVKQRQ